MITKNEAVIIEHVRKNSSMSPADIKEFAKQNGMNREIVGDMVNSGLLVQCFDKNLDSALRVSVKADRAVEELSEEKASRRHVRWEAVRSWAALLISIIALFQSCSIS